MSRAHKKNQKRATKKQEGKGFVVEESIGGAAAPTVTKQDPVKELRDQLAQAKAEKNHDLANKLRQQLWITQDLAAGYKPNISAEDEGSREALTQVQERLTTPASSLSSSTASVRLDGASAISTLGSEERKLKTLRKKLDQIQSLKKKLEQGETLEANQLTKLKTEESVLEEIEHLENLLSIPVKR
ncbi:uncharacterized protein LOC110984404 isoform X2 [Acanthaster planci]|nr:uncharacterized protein LOC110984404 isoform X2 [Acanthaster planci]